MGRVLTIDQRRASPLPGGGARRLPGLEGRVSIPARGAVLLSTVGSLGDLYPVLSVARALELAGIEARLALSPDDCEVARAWGLLAMPIGPSQDKVCRRLDTTRDEIAASVLRDPGPMMRDVLIPMLPDLVAQIEPLMQGVSAAAGTAFALAADLAAERAGIPYVPLLLQPMLTFSAKDPPRTGLFRLTRRAPGRAGLAWNRTLIATARAVLRRRHGRDLNAVRAGLGLPAFAGTPLVDHGAEVPLRIALWDEAFAPLPDDAPEGTQALGFPPAPEGLLAPDVRRWIGAGTPPLVVTMGSYAQTLAGPAFWAEAVALARAVGLRAVLLNGGAEVPEGPDILPLRYAPHSNLFPLAHSVIHHGGIGTTAEALRAGRPQTVVPIGGDQPDNAARLEAMGVARTIPLKRFTARHAEAALRDLLEGFSPAAAAKLGLRIKSRNGAGEAALHLARITLAAR